MLIPPLPQGSARGGRGSLCGPGAAPGHHERLGRGGGACGPCASRAGGGHDVVVPLALPPFGRVGGRLLCYLRPLQLHNYLPPEHRGWCVDDHECLHPVAVRGALLLPVHGVCKCGGRESGPAALLAEGHLLLRDGRRPHHHEPDDGHVAGQCDRLCHRGAVWTLCSGQKGRCHLLRPDPAAEAAGR